MSKQRALLMLTGGRGIPDMLVIKYLHPDITLILTTKQGLGTATHLKSLAKIRYDCAVEILPIIPPYKEEIIKDACKQALERYPDAEWIMNITSAPKVVGIFGVDIARERNIPCWFLNTDESEVVSLSRDIPFSSSQLFSATVEEYMDVYQRQYEKRESPEYRIKAESWYPIAQLLAQYPTQTHLFLHALRKAQERKKQTETIKLTLDLQAKPLLTQLASADPHLIVIANETLQALECIVSGGEKRKFILGDWLEVYVSKEVEKTGFAQDQQWGYKVFHDKDEYELDIAVTSRGLLLLGECKTDDDPYTGHSKYLDTVDANAGLLGHSYVNKYFITNHPDPSSVASYTSFYQQASQKKIRIVNADELPRIGKILEEEVTNPKYTRI